MFLGNKQETMSIKTRMHSNRMRTARLLTVSGGRERRFASKRQTPMRETPLPPKVDPPVERMT